MQAPPPYSAPGGRKSNVGLILALVVGGVALCCILPIGFFGFFVNGAMKGTFGYMSCGRFMMNLQSGLEGYAKAHDGKLPNKETWEDDIEPYVKKGSKSRAGFTIPSGNSDVCDATAKTTLCFNQALSGVRLDSIKDQEKTVLLWEQPGPGRNQFGEFTTEGKVLGPKIVGNVPRGWLILPVSGHWYYLQPGGRKFDPDSLGADSSASDSDSSSKG